MEEEQVSVVKSMRSCSVVLVPTFCVAAAALHTSVHPTACSRRTRLIACNEPDGPTALFTALCAQHSPMAAVALTGSAQNGGGRRLVTTRSVQAGEIILTVPPELLLTSHRSGVIAGLQGQTELMWEAAGDLRQEVGEELFKRGATWDVRLALAVFEDEKSEDTASVLGGVRRDDDEHDWMPSALFGGGFFGIDGALRLDEFDEEEEEEDEGSADDGIDLFSIGIDTAALATCAAPDNLDVDDAQRSRTVDFDELEPAQSPRADLMVLHMCAT